MSSTINIFTMELHCIDVGGLRAANWDGIRDNETGILIYTWTVGTTVCGDDVVEYNDPHEHLSTRSDWTHVGLAFPLKLPGNRRIHDFISLIIYVHTVGPTYLFCIMSYYYNNYLVFTCIYKHKKYS